MRGNGPLAVYEVDKFQVEKIFEGVRSEAGDLPGVTRERSALRYGADLGAPGTVAVLTASSGRAITPASGLSVACQ